MIVWIGFSKNLDEIRPIVLDLYKTNTKMWKLSKAQQKAYDEATHVISVINHC